MRVEVYWNLHKKCWSMRALEGPRKGRVVEHCNAVLLVDVDLVVQPAGRQRVLEERRKNVHAFARGTLHAAVPASAEHRHGALRPCSNDEITYNPYREATFVQRTKEGARLPIEGAEVVALTSAYLRPVVTGVGMRYKENS